VGAMLLDLKANLTMKSVVCFGAGLDSRVQVRLTARQDRPDNVELGLPRTGDTGRAGFVFQHERPSRALARPREVSSPDACKGGDARSRDRRSLEPCLAGSGGAV
jgi:hypothetical protein